MCAVLSWVARLATAYGFSYYRPTMPVFTTACPRNCYSTCTARVHVEDGRIVRLEPHTGNHATPEGVCLKGLSYVERTHSPDRLLHPLRRRPGTSEHTRISWDGALDTIAGKLERARDALGPQSIFFYAASGTKGLLNQVSHDFWRLFGGYTTTYGDLCWPAGLEATRLTLGENKHSDPADVARAKLIVMWGKNPAETNIHQTVFINDALEAGGRLVVIDPRRTETAERAHLLIQPRPGTDGALALGLAHLLVRRGQIDDAFIANHVLGFDAYREMIEAYPPERVAAITGVSRVDVERLAELIGAQSPVTINAGFGMQRYVNSGQTMRAIIALLAITGNIGKPGAGWVFANLTSHIFGEVKDPVGFYPPSEPDGVVRVSVSTALLGRQMLEQRDPPLEIAWVERGNPVTQNPNTNEVLEAFRALDFRVVVEQFMTDTAREADIVLPAKTMFEQSDVINAYWHDYVQIKQKVIEPPGEVKPETEVYRLLAERLGFPEAAIAETLPGPSDEAIEAYIEKRLAPFPDLTLEKLKEGPIRSPDHEEVAFSDRRFSTPSGRIELLSTEAQNRWQVDVLPVFREPAIASETRYPLYMMTPNTKNAIHSQFHNLQSIRRHAAPPRLSLHPTDAAERGIAASDPVRVFNDRGEIVLPAHLDPGIRRGAVAANNGWWIRDGGTVNFLSPALETDMGYGAAFHETRVDVEKVKA